MQVAIILGVLLLWGYGCCGQTATFVGVGHQFNCDRAGVECYGNSSTCFIGTCDCMADLGGPDCLYNTSNVVDSGCEPECENNGTCVTLEDGSNQCYCEVGYYGDTCELERLYHDCTHDSMDISVTPSVGSGNFSGFVYILDQEGDSACVFETDPASSGTLAKSVPFTACGGVSNVTNADGDSEVAFPVILQYGSLYLDSNDERFQFRCIIRQSGGELSFVSDVISEGNFDLNDIDNGNRDEALIPVEVSITNVDGSAVSGPQTIGKKLNINYQFNGGALYEGFRVEDIVATNGLEEDSARYLEIPLVTDGCVEADASDRVVSEFSGSPDSEYDLEFSVFKFLHSNQLLFKTNVLLCDVLADCAAVNCSSEDGPETRTRRSATIRESTLNTIARHPRDVTTRREVDASVWVVYPGQSNIGSNPDFDSVRHHTTTDAQNPSTTYGPACVSSLVVIILSFVLATLFIIALGCCVFYVMRVQRVVRHASAEKHTYFK